MSPETLKRICPKRLSWLPGVFTGFDEVPLVSYPEVGHSYVRAVHDLFCRTNHPISRRRLHKFVNPAGRRIRAALRNEDVVIGALVSTHCAEKNTVVEWVVDPAYRHHNIDLHLLYLAALELPEAPTHVWVRESELPRQLRLKKLGWTADEVEDGRIRFTHAPLCRLVDESSEARGPEGEDASWVNEG